MPSKPSVGFVNTIKAGFNKACTNPPDWYKLFGEAATEFLLHYSLNMNSRPEVVIGLLLLAVSALMGPLTTITSDYGANLKPNIFLLIIAEPGTGKSGAFTKLITEPFRKMNMIFEQKILTDGTTVPALMAKLAENQGYGLVCSDEIVNRLFGWFDKAREDVKETRTNLNNLWSGTSYSKEYKGGAKRFVDFPSSYFCLGGTGHPIPTAELINLVFGYEDGFEDRLLFLCGDIIEDHKYSKVDESKFKKLPDRWIVELFFRVFREHEMGVEYSFDDEVLTYIRNVRKAANAQRDESILEYRKILLSSSPNEIDDIVFPEAPKNTTDTKDVDYTQKLAVPLHVMKFHLHELQTTGMVQTNRRPPTTISMETYEAALHFMSRLRTHTSEMVGHVQMAAKASTSFERDLAGARAGNLSIKPIDLVNLICQYPGPVISSQHLHRKYHGRANFPTALVIHETMVSIGKPNKGEPGYFGKHRMLPNSGTNLFYKAPIEDVDKQFLLSHGVTEAQYTEAFNLDVSIRKPRSSRYKDLAAWQRVYKEWLDGAPEGIDYAT